MMKALKTSSSSKSSSPPSSSSNTSTWIHIRSVLLLLASSNSSPALYSSSSSSSRARLKSPWSRRKRKHILSPQQWRDLFTLDGKLHDNGATFLKKVRSGGVDPSIRREIWPFLLGVYDLTSSKEERDITRTKNRKEYDKLRRQCRRLLKHNTQLCSNSNQSEGTDSEDVVSARQSLSSEDSTNTPEVDFEFDSNSDDPDTSQTSAHSQPHRSGEDFATWQRIIRLDAIRANDDWMEYNSAFATSVSDGKEKAHQAAKAVGLKDYDHLAPARIFHASRLVSILEAYALHDPETGYCQGMSDLLSPIITVMKEDHEAFWCFVGFMKKARHNFRVDEVGIRRQLSKVSNIIKYKDMRLYRHLEKLEAEDCFFVYRMVVVVFRRELSFEQTLCLWEAMWADQAAIRAGIGRATDDLLLYAIAASVLQRRKMIVERYGSVDEILRECNGMAGQLDVWKLLDDAHGLVVALHDKIKSRRAAAFAARYVAAGVEDEESPSVWTFRVVFLGATSFWVLLILDKYVFNQTAEIIMGMASAMELVYPAGHVMGMLIAKRMVRYRSIGLEFSMNDGWPFGLREYGMISILANMGAVIGGFTSYTVHWSIS